jgi:ATP-dependent Clp protease ATP-binding subunit ClpA
MQDRDRFDRFTERARKVLSLAQEEAQRFQHNYIGTEHLLLGLVREGEGVAARVLANLGIELSRVRGAVEFIIGRGDRIVLGEIGLTPRAKKVIELAVDEAHRMNHHYIGTEHLLLGLVREGSGIAAGVLESLGINLEKVRTETIHTLSQVGAAAATPKSAPDASLHWRFPRSENYTLTEQAGNVLSYAREEARRLQHDAVRPEHMLLGLVHEADGLAARVLSEMGVDLVKTRSAVEELVKRGERQVIDLDLAPLAKAQIHLAADEAERLGHDLIGTRHLLLGLLRTGENAASRALGKLGIDLAQLREKTLQASDKQNEKENPQ